MLKDDKVRHQFCPSGDISWCKFRRLGNMENAPHHLEPVFLDLLEPLCTNCLSSFELLSQCLPGVTQNVLESINSILWQKVPKHKFHGTKRVHIGACSTVIYYNRVQQANLVFSRSCLSLCFSNRYLKRYWKNERNGKLRKPLRMRKDCVKVVQHIQQENFEY